MTTPDKPSSTSFFQIKAIDIEEWAGKTLLSRQRLPVFLRILVNSTSEANDLSKVNFPGNDNSERRGWDGETIAKKGNAWIPEGRSCWEFGVNADPKAKATDDYKKRFEEIDKEARKEITFVFVTPRIWKGKDKWADERKKDWLDVRVYDACDLEQWLETSSAAQIWFANEARLNIQGAQSLDKLDEDWAADCVPPLMPSLFEEAVKQHRDKLLTYVEEAPSYEPRSITADTGKEALAFLSAVFTQDDQKTACYRDRIIIFNEPSALTKLAREGRKFIPVISSREVEKEFAPYSKRYPSFIINPRHDINISKNEKADDSSHITLTILSEGIFRKALASIGLESDRIRQLARETGRSLTVLRRRLSKLPAIRTPDWADNNDTRRRLIPIAFAEKWDGDNKEDQTVLEMLTGDHHSYEALERCVTELLPIDDSPLWAVKDYRGTVSKIDTLFAIKNSILRSDLERFFQIAEIVFSEDDESLDLHEGYQWLAPLFNLKSKLSRELREGLADTLIFLSVFGKDMFAGRMRFDCANEASLLVEKLLKPLTLRKLESQYDLLPIYAEAAPDAFLSILEEDLDSPDSISLQLLTQPINDPLFQKARHVGLLRALETLAWNEITFWRTVSILCRFSEITINDTIHSRLLDSLFLIFYSPLPQTDVSLEKREIALKEIVKQYPKIGWSICLAQFSRHAPIIVISDNKPRWRSDGASKRDVVTIQDWNDFGHSAFNLALNWPHHTLKTICALIGALGKNNQIFHADIWDLVEKWIATASDEEKVTLRDAIRNYLSHISYFWRSQKNVTEETLKKRAKTCFELAAPKDLILRNAWLFSASAMYPIDSSSENENTNYEIHKEFLIMERTDAIRVIFASGGIKDILRLAEKGPNAGTIGEILANIIDSDEKHIATIVELTNNNEIKGASAEILSKLLLPKDINDTKLLRAVISSLPEEKCFSVLLCAPFHPKTWEIVEKQGNIVKAEYWENVESLSCLGLDTKDVRLAVDQITKAGRLIQALNFLWFFFYSYKKDITAREIYNSLVKTLFESKKSDKDITINNAIIINIVNYLLNSTDITLEEKANLEFHFVDKLTNTCVKFINSSRLMIQQPEEFCKKVAFLYKRTDGKSDPSEPQINDDKTHDYYVDHAERLFENIEPPVGPDFDFFQDKEQIVNWVKTVRSILKKRGRSNDGERMIGQFFSKAPAAQDGIWPCLPVREALEEILTKEMERSIIITIYNTHSACWGGSDKVKTDSAQYEKWAKSMEGEYPKVSTIMKIIATYLLDFTHKFDERNESSNRTSN